ncbi:alkaline phosphatase family protein [bacterium]|nr:alkaline phosphatase family protein [candidate division CSSED10-310 bacterium]
MMKTIVQLSIIMLLLSGCHQLSDTTSQGNPSGLTILGLDGATWEIIDPLIEKGELPGFKHLKEKGSWGNLQTFQPTESISIWTTIATGLTPTRHGLQTFTRRIPGTDRFVPSPSSDRRVPALWNICSENGKRVVAVKWFASWPAEPVNGAFLSSRLEAEDSDPRTYPTELFKEIDPIRYQTTMDQLPQPPLPGKDSFAKPADVLQPKERVSGGPPMLIGQNEVKSTMFDDTTVWLAGKHVYDKYKPDLFMIYLKSTDRVQHFLWGAQTGDPDNPRITAEADAIYGWYKFYDRIILDLLADPSRIVMVLSDHGFQALDDTPNPFNVWDLDFDRILEFCGILLTDDTGTDWARTRCYSYRPLPFDRAVEYRLNLKNREPEGIVDPDTAVSVLTAVRDTLTSLKTEEGIQLFSEIQIDDISSTLTCSLDNSINLDQTLVFGEKRRGLRDMIFRKGLPRGIHTDAPSGILAVCGPGIRTGNRITGARVYDITPTSLYSLGLAVADDFDGVPLISIFEEKWIEHHPMQHIASYGTRMASDNLTATQGDLRLINELRALGYIQ